MQLKIGPCRLDAIIQNAIETMQFAADAKNITVATQLDASASLGLCDEARMQQVIWNLLSNAIKFTPPDGKVTVRLARNKMGVEIQVIDTGAGVAPDFLPDMFERFRQADTGPRRRTGGLGLGLSIVKHIVEMHGGAVEAFSEGIGKGTTFTITLPVRALQANDAEREAMELRRRHGQDGALPARNTLKLLGLRVLVVDDQADARRLLVKVFEAAGGVVTTAASAAEAMQILEQWPPEILVSDLGMPNEDGYDLIKKIRQSGYNAKELPAVALTAFAGCEHAERALLSGFQAHIPKPVDPRQLLVVVASIAGLTG